MNQKENDKLSVAFVQGAKWWEYYSQGATMWQSDQRLAEEEATTRLERGTLGELPEALKKENETK